MQATRTTIIRRALLMSVLLLPTAAYAVNWNMGGHEHTEGGGPQGPRYNMPDGSISQHDAVTIQDYYRSLAASVRCPAGSIPGAGGCTPAIPPGRWVAGQRMSSDVPAEPLPPDLAARLNPFDGYHYVRHGGDVLLVINGTDIVAAGMAIPVR
jgi:hypothetical protein